MTRLLGVVPPPPEVRAQLRPDPVDVPPHVPTRREVVRLDQAGLHPALQRAHADAQFARSLGGGHIRHVGRRWALVSRFSALVSRLAANGMNFGTILDPIDTGSEGFETTATPARAPA